MIPFELRHLRYFVAVAEELHFGRAAKRLNIAQPPLSQQIQQFESRLGAKLFKRTSRHAELTPAGAVMLEHARRLLRDAQHATDAVRRAARGEVDTLRVGFADSAALSILPAVVRAFRELRPDVHLELSESSTQAQLAALERSAVDVVLVRGPVNRPDLHAEVLLTEALIAVVPSDHPLAVRGEVVLAALESEPFVLFPRHLAPEFFDAIVSLCRGAGFSPDVRAEGAEYQTILSLVAANLGISLVPASVQNLPRAGVTFVPLVGTVTSATVVVAHRPDRASKPAREFIELAGRLRQDHKRG